MRLRSCACIAGNHPRLGNKCSATLPDIRIHFSLQVQRLVVGVDALRGRVWLGR